MHATLYVQRIYMHQWTLCTLPSLVGEGRSPLVHGYIPYEMRGQVIYVRAMLATPTTWWCGVDRHSIFKCRCGTDLSALCRGGSTDNLSCYTLTLPGDDDHIHYWWSVTTYVFLWRWLWKLTQLLLLHLWECTITTTCVRPAALWLWSVVCGSLGTCALRGEFLPNVYHWGSFVLIVLALLFFNDALGGGGCCFLLLLRTILKSSSHNCNAWY